MSSVDERVVKMTFDNKQFESGVQKSIKSLNEFDKNLDKMEKSSAKLKTVEDASKRIDFSGLSSGLDKVMVKFDALDVAAMNVISRITNDVINAAKKVSTAVPNLIKTGGWNRALNIEKAKFMFEGMGMDVKTAMNDALVAVKGTAYGLDEAAKVAGQLGASGISLGKDMQKSLRGIAGVAAMTSSSFSEIGQIFTAVAARGKAYSSDFNRIAVRGVAAFDIVAEHMGITVQQLQEMMRDPKAGLSADVFIEAFTEKFAKQATKANKTYEGALSNMKAAFSRLGATVQGVRLENLRKIFNSITPVIDKFTKALDPVIKKFIKIDNKLRKFATSFLKSKHLVGGVLKNGKKIKGFIYNISKAFNGFLNYLWTMVRPIKNAFQMVFGEIKGWRLAKRLNNFAKFLNIFFNKSYKGARSLGKSLKPLRIIFKGIFSVVSILIRSLKGLSRIVLGLVQVIFKLVLGTKNIGKGFRKLAEAIKPIFNFFYKIDQLFNKHGTSLYKLSEQYDTLAEQIDKFKKVIRKYINAFKKQLFPIVGSLRKLIISLLSPFDFVNKKIESFIKLKNPNKRAKALANVVKFLENNLGNFKNVLTSVKTGIDNITAKLEILKKAFMNIGIVKTITEDLKNFQSSFSVGSFATPFVVFGKIVSGVFSFLYNAVLKFFGLFTGSKTNNTYTNLKHNLGPVKDFLVSFADDTQKVLKDFGEYISNFFNRFFGNNDFFTGLNQLTKAFATGGFGALLWELMRTTKKIREEGGPLTKLVNSINGTLGHLSKYLQTLQKTVKADIILKIGEAVALLAGSIWLLSTIPIEKLAPVAGVVAGLIFSIAFAMKVLSTSLKDFAVSSAKISGSGLSVKAGNPFAGMSAVIISFGFSILLLSTAIKKLGRMDSDELMQGLTAIIYLVAGLAFGMAAIAVAMKKSRSASGGNEKYKNAVERAANAMKTMAQSLVIAAIGVRILSKIDEDAFARTMGAAAGIVIVMAGTLTLMSRYASNTGGYKATSSGNKGFKSKMERMAEAMKTMSKALIVAAVAMRIIGKMDWSVWSRGLIGITAISAIFAGLSLLLKMKVLKNPEVMQKLMTAFILMSTAFVIAAIAMKKIARIGDSDFEKVLTSLAVIAGIFAGFALISRYINKAAISDMGVAFVLLSASFLILSRAMKNISKLSWDDVGKSLGIFVTYLLALVAASYIVAPVSPILVALGAASLMMGVGLLAAAKALKIFIECMSKISNDGTIINGLNKFLELIPNFVSNLIMSLLNTIKTAIPQIVETLLDTIILILKAIASKFPQIVKLAGVIFASLTKEIVKVAAKLSPGEVAVVVGSIAILTLCVTMLAQAGKQAKDAIKGIALFGVTVGLLSIIFGVLLQYTSGDDILKTALGFSALILSMTTMMVALSLLGPMAMGATAAIKPLAIMIGALTAILIALGAIYKIPFVKDLIKSGGELLGAIGTAIGKLIGGFVGGIASEFSKSLPKIGTSLSKFMTNMKPFLKGLKTINKNMIQAAFSIVKIMLAFTAANLINSISKFFGAEDICDYMVRFGQSLAKLGPHLATFALTTMFIKPKHVKAAADSALMLAKVANALPRSGGLMGSILGETMSLATFGKNLKTFGEDIADFAETVKDINSKKVKAASESAKMLSEVAKNLPKEGGWLESIVGKTQSMSEFAKQLPALAAGLAGYYVAVNTAFSNKVGKFDENTLNLLEKSIEIANKFASLAQTIADIKIDAGSFKAIFTGSSTSLSNFANQIAELGKGLVKFAKYVAVGFDYKDKDLDRIVSVGGIFNTGRIEQMDLALQKTKDFIGLAGEIAKLIDPSDFQLLFGNNNATTLKNFGQQLPWLAKGLVEFSQAISGNITALYDSGGIPRDIARGAKHIGAGMDAEAIKKALEPLKALIEPIINLTKYTDSDELSQAKDLLEVISKMDFSFLTKMPEDLNVTAVKNVGDALSSLFIPLEELSTYANSEQITALKDLLSTLSGFNLNDMINTFNDEDSMKKIEGAGKEIGNRIDLGLRAVLGIGPNVNLDDAKATTMTKMARVIFNSLCNGMKSGSFDEAVGKVIEKLKTTFESDKYKSKIVEIGFNITKGLVKGMTSKDGKKEVRDAGKQLGEIAKKSTKKALEQKSPSKAYWRMGLNNDKGLAFGMLDNLKLISDASKKAGDTAVDSISMPMETISNLLSEDLDSNPVITPVLDLSNIQNGSGLIDNLLTPNALSFGMGVNASLNSSYDKPAKNTPKVYNDSKVVGAIGELQSDIGTLNNNISNLKVVMNTGEMVGVLSPRIDKSLGVAATYKERGI